MINATPTTATAAVIAAFSLLISSGLLGAIFVYFRRLVEARIGATHTAQAIAITGEAVRAAEQIGRTHGLDPQAKYREAAERATALLNGHGIALSADQMRTFIEGAVTQIKQANAAGAMPGVVLTGDSPTVNAAPAMPSGPSSEQLLAAITTAIMAVYPQSGPAPQPGESAPVQAPVQTIGDSAPIASVSISALAPATPVPLGGPTTA